MTQSVNLSFILIVTLSMGCINSTSKKENINAITDISEFSVEIGKEKLNQVTPISKKELCGEWEIITSLHTITYEGGGKGNILSGREGNRLKVEANGNLTYLIQNSNTYYKKSYTYYGKWSLNHEKTVFKEDFSNEHIESFKVRVQGDTMEWINPLYDENFSYLVLVKR